MRGTAKARRLCTNSWSEETGQVIERDTTFTTFSTTYGFTNEAVENVIAYYPFMGRCIGERGLESLDFEHGERVEVELTVYDYAGNAAAPVTQTIEWPIEQSSSGCAVQAGRNAFPAFWLALLSVVVLVWRRYPNSETRNRM